MDLAYDPDDQFFQAFKAGYVRRVDDRGDYVPPSDKNLWNRYIAWLHEKP